VDQERTDKTLHKIKNLMFKIQGANHICDSVATELSNIILELEDKKEN
jgi:hypothetical protein